MGEFVIFLRYKTRLVAVDGESEQHTVMLYQKCAYQMKVNFFHAVIGPRWMTLIKKARLQIAMQYELSLYHFTPETRDSEGGLFGAVVRRVVY